MPSLERKPEADLMPPSPHFPPVSGYWVVTGGAGGEKAPLAFRPKPSLRLAQAVRRKEKV